MPLIVRLSLRASSRACWTICFGNLTDWVGFLSAGILSGNITTRYLDVKVRMLSDLLILCIEISV